jgi:hypothetical protein
VDSGTHAGHTVVAPLDCARWPSVTSPAEHQGAAAVNARRLAIPAALAAIALAAAVSAVGAPAAAVSAGVTPTDQFPANVDYDNTGGYGAYSPTVFNDSYVQGVDINVDWATVEPSPGNYDWTQLDTTANAWANAGKHIVLVVRAANETGGATVNDGFVPPTCTADPDSILPTWEINALGFDGTLCDSDLESIVPDWFSSTFQTDFLQFVSALGQHVKGEGYHTSISYVRIGVGLGGEAFPVMPNGTGTGCDFSDPSDSTPPCQQDEASYKAWMTQNWDYSGQAWENFQETMLAAYDAAFPAVPLIYPITVQDNDAAGTPVDYAVAEWATTHYSNIGIGQECLSPGGFGSYADFGTIDTMVRDDWNPDAYIQFQTCGPTTTAADEQGIITAAENYGARSIEWYEATFLEVQPPTGPPEPPSVPDMTAYQTWVNNTFG